MKPTQKQQYSRSSSSIYLIDYWSCLCPELRPSRPEGWAGGVEGRAGSCWVLSSGEGSTGTRPLRWLSRWTLGSRFGLDSYLEEEMGEEWREWRLNGEGSRERTKGKRWKRKQFNQTKMNSTESLASVSHNKNLSGQRTWWSRLVRRSGYTPQYLPVFLNDYTSP